MMKNDYGLRSCKVQLIYFGLPVDQFLPCSTEEKRAVRNRWKIPSDKPVIGFIGRLATEKNADFLVRFMARQQIRYPDLHCAIAGTGDCEKAIRQAADASGCTNRIHFLGYTRKPQEIYPLCDLHILPSAFEGFPLTIIEAAYCGIPSLRSNVQGSSDQIEDGISGFIFDIDGGYKAFECKLIDILDHHWERLHRIGSASHEKCIQMCDMTIYEQRMDAFYRALMKA
jgi:glycosyltransferase involved in cell wall biosynthesis